jgi:hypothetical protein|tara:strand:- start:294 stop:431 length:138 start_codon:yes stop_codon:yes gene_type:complete
LGITILLPVSPMFFTVDEFSWSSLDESQREVLADFEAEWGILPVK